MKLKKIFLPALALISLSAASQAPDQPSDTLISKANVKSVTVTKEGRISTITLKGTDTDSKYFYSLTTEVDDTNDRFSFEDDEWGLSLPFLNQKSHKKSKVVWGNDFYLGVTLPTSAPDGLNGSIEVGLGKIVGLELSPWQGGPQFGIGFGFHYRQYTLHHQQIFSADQHILSIVKVDADHVSSRLRNFGFQVPFTIGQNISHNFGVSIGIAAMFNTFARAASDYVVNDLRYHNSYRGLQQRLVTFDLLASIGWSNALSAYVRYSPANLFPNQWGPQFKTLSFGITLSM